MSGNVEVDHSPSLLSQHDENEQQLKGYRRHDEEVRGSQL
jgi:hypothetical protein